MQKINLVLKNFPCQDKYLIYFNVKVRRVNGEATKTDFSVVSYNILADCHMKPDW